MEETKRFATRRFPHARGGEPSDIIEPKPNMESFPHARGGEPAAAWLEKSDLMRFPHARGGEPTAPTASTATTKVFPTHVGVNLSVHIGFSPVPAFSPRTWG